MLSKLALVRLLAVLCRPLLGIVTAFALSLSTGITLRFLPGSAAPIWQSVGCVIAWIPLTTIVAGLAALFGPYDLLVIVTCVLPALLFFALNYGLNVSTYLPDDGHTFHDIAGGIPPLNFVDNLAFLLRLLLWALSAAAAGILLKRWLSRLIGKGNLNESEPSDTNHLWRGIAIDLGFVGLVLFVVLAVNLRNQLRLGSPEVLTANVERTLDSVTSTPTEREIALDQMRRYSDKFLPADTAKAVAIAAARNANPAAAVESGRGPTADPVS